MQRVFQNMFIETTFNVSRGSDSRMEPASHVLCHMFVDCLDETDEQLVEFAIGGICNMCLGE